MKIALFGGTFNPIHNGHLFIANQALRHVDQVWFIPNKQNPLKNTEAVSLGIRCEMIRLAINDEHRFRLSTIEGQLPEPSYTVDLVKQLRIGLQTEELYLLLGDDCLNEFYLWKDYKEILKECRLIVHPRLLVNVHSHEDYDEIKLDAPIISISSTEIRDMV